MPPDRQSVESAIQHMRTTLTTSLPNFDLNIGYYDVKKEGRASKDLVKIRYRHQEGNDGCEKGIAPLRAGILNCEFK